MKKRLLSIALALSLIAPVCASPTAEAYGKGMVDLPTVVSVGSYHSGAVDTDGNLWMWGVNAYGYLCQYSDADSYNAEWLEKNGVSPLTISRSK